MTISGPMALTACPTAQSSSLVKQNWCESRSSAREWRQGAKRSTQLSPHSCTTVVLTLCQLYHPDKWILNIIVFVLKFKSRFWFLFIKFTNKCTTTILNYRQKKLLLFNFRRQTLYARYFQANMRVGQVWMNVFNYERQNDIQKRC